MAWDIVPRKSRHAPRQHPTRGLVPGLLLFGLALVPTAPRALAQKAPEAGYAFPPGGRAGTTVEVQLGGYDWTPDTQFLSHEPGVTLQAEGPPGAVRLHDPPYWFGIKAMANDPPLPREVRARFTLPENCPPGPVYWSVANANGGSTTRVFLVGDGEEAVEDEARTGPQELLRLPVTVSGRLGRIEEVDRYQFRAPRDGVITCELTARRLGSDIRGVLEVRDDQGQVVADAVDTRGADPVLAFEGRAGHGYTVDVRDFDYRGFRSSVYRLTVTPGPRVLAALPASGRRGETREVTFLGIGVATGRHRVERVSRQVTFAADPALAAFPYPLETPWGTSPPFTLFLSELAETIELPHDPAQALPLAPGTAVTALLGPGEDTRRYTFEGKAGDPWSLRAEAQKLGSPLDLSITVLGPDGKELARVDDTAGTTDPAHDFRVPADGTYRVEVSALTPPSDEDAATFRLVAERPAEDFALQAFANVNVPLGGSAPLTVSLARLGGYAGTVTLSVRGLPPGVTAPWNPTIAPTETKLAIPLTAAATAPAVASLVTVVATGTLRGETVSRTAQVPAAGNLAPRSPAEATGSRILVATTLKVPFGVTPVDADGGRRVHRGATYAAALLIERRDGFDGPIVLDMAATQSRHRQGIRGPAFPVAPGVGRVAYPVVVSEWLETSRTSRLALVASATVPDGQGTPRTVLAPMTGQITLSIEGALLKLSHGAGEWSVAPGETLRVPLKVARASRIDGPVRIELIAPEALRDLWRVEPLEVPAGKEAVDWVLVTPDSPGLIGRHALTLRATAATEGGLPVVSETAVEVEFLAGRPER